MGKVVLLIKRCISLFMLVSFWSTSLCYADDWLSPGVNSLKSGLSKKQVLSKAGKPDCAIVKDNPKENLFGQSNLEVKIKEAWIYKSKKERGYGLEVYFNVSGVVIGINGGYGLTECAAHK